MTPGTDLETALAHRAWTDPAFARRLVTDPAGALEDIGVTIPDGVRLDIRLQNPDTMYYVIPPAIDPAADECVVEQLDLWRSGDQFVWIVPGSVKVGLLQMRQRFREAAEKSRDHRS